MPCKLEEDQIQHGADLQGMPDARITQVGAESADESRHLFRLARVHAQVTVLAADSGRRWSTSDLLAMALRARALRGRGLLSVIGATMGV